jgi:hypothetical protein
MNRSSHRLQVIGFFLILQAISYIRVPAAEEQSAISNLFTSDVSINGFMLNVRLTYKGQTPLEVYNLIDRNFQVISPGKWIVYTPDRPVFTGPGIITTQTLKKGEALEGRIALAKLFSSITPGRNEFTIEITLVTVDKRSIKVRQTVSANFTAEQLASGWHPTDLSDIR